MARSTTTLKQLLSDARMLVRGQGVNFTAPTNESMIKKYNIAINSVFDALNGAKVGRFLASSPLGTPASYIKMLATDNHTYTAATKVISEAAGTALIIDSTFVGALVIYGTTGLVVAFDTIASVVTNTSFTLNEGRYASNIAAGSLRYIVLKKPTTITGLSIATHRVHDIQRVLMTATGNCPRLTSETYAGVGNNPNYDSSVVMEQSGSGGNAVINLTAGSGVTNSGGYPVIFYDQKPKMADDVDEYVDLPDEFHGPLTEEVARLAFVEAGSKVPKALEAPLTSLNPFVDTFQAMKDILSRSEDVP